jgi:hypothetical protein
MKIMTSKDIYYTIMRCVLPKRYNDYIIYMVQRHKIELCFTFRPFEMANSTSIVISII